MARYVSRFYRSAAMMIYDTMYSTLCKLLATQ